MPPSAAACAAPPAPRTAKAASALYTGIRMILVSSLSGLEHEQDHEGDDQREQRNRFREREAQEHVAEHAGGGFRVAQGALDEAAEDVADADTHAGEGDGGEAGADELGCRSVHLNCPFEVKESCCG